MIGEICDADLAIGFFHRIRQFRTPGRRVQHLVADSKFNVQRQGRFITHIVGISIARVRAGTSAREGDQDGCEATMILYWRSTARTWARKASMSACPFTETAHSFIHLVSPALFGCR